VIVQPAAKDPVGEVGIRPVLLCGDGVIVEATPRRTSGQQRGPSYARPER